MSKRLLILLIVLSTCLSLSFNIANADDKKTATKKPSYYLIGNSLTWDTIPPWLDGDVQWHVDCGKPLTYIYEHSEKPCVKTSTLWNKALKEKQYDFVSVQPHYGSTLKTDVATISKWMKMQPKAIFIIHSGWARQKTRAEEYLSRETSGKMVHAPGYYTNLIKELKKTFPKRKFRQTHAIDLLDQIAEDIENKKAPFKDIAELHRDAIHMKTETGRYLMHNAMRIALGQPISDKHFDKTTEEHKAYFNKLLKAQK